MALAPSARYQKDFYPLCVHTSPKEKTFYHEGRHFSSPHYRPKRTFELHCECWAHFTVFVLFHWKLAGVLILFCCNGNASSNFDRQASLTNCFLQLQSNWKPKLHLSSSDGFRMRNKQMQHSFTLKQQGAAVIVGYRVHPEIQLLLNRTRQKSCQVPNTVNTGQQGSWEPV